MIIKYSFDNRLLFLVDRKKIKSNKNIFTVLVGKNGAGKSRFLSAVVEKLIETKKYTTYGSNKEIEFLDFKHGAIDYDITPSKIIALSTSPFDRFPLVRNRKENSNYSYLGIRELISSNLGLAYIGKIIGSLIDTIIKEPGRIKRIASVLNHLGYTDKITIRFNTRISSRQISDIIESTENYSKFESVLKERRPFFTFNRRFFENDDGSFSKSKINYLRKAFDRINNSRELTKGYSELIISKHGIKKQYSFSEYYTDLIFFIQSGIIRLSDVILEKNPGNSPFSIISASSGEQSTIISILGLASQILDNSVICIDEPEICLHPEWQEKYIQLLVDTFCDFKGCHFIIATHSPQIVSNLKEENSFILSMESGTITNAIDVVKNSIDFQLASVFNSPGFKNEYLTRISLNTFIKVTKNKAFDEVDLENYLLLKSQSTFMSSEDPVLDLFRALNDLHNIYGRN